MTEVKEIQRSEELYSLPEVAELYSVTTTQVRNAIKRGDLKASKLGWVYVIRGEDLPDTWYTKK